MSKITFILGGARSGKSAYAERLAAEYGRPKIYLATAEALDDEMKARVAAHQKRRGPEWKTLEVPVEISATLMTHSNAVILVDCLTLWLSNLMHKKLDIADYTQTLLDTLGATKAHVILVSNEVGQGIVPDNALARQFSDAAGILHQRIAGIADRVVQMTAGIPVRIKG